MSADDLFERRKDLGGAVLNNCMLSWPPLTVILKGDENKRASGLFGDVAAILQKVQ